MYATHCIMVIYPFAKYDMPMRKQKKKKLHKKRAKTTRVGHESAQAYGRTDTVIPIYLPELCSWGYKPSLIVFLVLVLSHLTNKPLVLTLSVLKVTLIGFFHHSSILENRHFLKRRWCQAVLFYPSEHRLNTIKTLCTNASKGSETGLNGTKGKNDIDLIIKFFKIHIIN